uniref:Uncharacterized protein n=1 Tax=Arundo donax TaxID=35708 RepID=A0A0A8XQJ6_ARUDO
MPLCKYLTTTHTSNIRKKAYCTTKTC